MFLSTVNNDRAGGEMLELMQRVWPLHRCVTGDGVRETLRVLGETIPLEITEVPTGTRILDWTVPQEWNIRDAYIQDASGVKVVDYGQSNLHVVGYSQGVRARLCWNELQPHLSTLPEKPDWIPYRVDQQGDWGFCLSHRQYEALASRGNVDYDIVIDAQRRDGSLSYGECYLPGKSSDEVLFSAHVCHPSLANDNLSGIAVSMMLAKALAKSEHWYSYRFVFAPATIGAIAWLANNRERTARIQHGLVLALLGHPGQSTYKKSRRGNAAIDQIVEYVLRQSESPFEIRQFTPLGYDERQFCSPGFNLPVGCLMRTPNGEYPEYHTSADDMSLIAPTALVDSLAKCLSIVEIVDNSHRYLNPRPYGEPALGKHSLYRAYGAADREASFQEAILWTLNLSDGAHTLLDIALRSGLRFPEIRRAAAALSECGLLETCNRQSLSDDCGLKSVEEVGGDAPRRTPDAARSLLCELERFEPCPTNR
ncbi:MAG TPA: DUF4910 domain-containing protein [Pirellulaceae bacterium]|nr:DUF4910 domain-containing protein [Pirellulaceae bacterium]